MNYILDACALFALIADEQGGELVNGLLDKARSGETSVYMSKVNLLEIYYNHIRDLGIDRADEIIDSVYASPIRVIEELDDSVFREAGTLKANYRISLADSVALASAKVLDLAVVTAGHHEMDAVEQGEPIKFLWIR